MYSALGTVIGPHTKVGQDGVEWFSLKVHARSRCSTPGVGHPGCLTVKDKAYGYLVAPNGNTFDFPSFVLDSHGNGAITGNLIGPDYYPSHALVVVRNGRPTGPIVDQLPGAAPDDSYTCYGGAPCRWGDYSNGEAIDGGVIVGSEYIPQDGRTNTSNGQANWGHGTTGVRFPGEKT